MSFYSLVVRAMPLLPVDADESWPPLQLHAGGPDQNSVQEPSGHVDNGERAVVEQAERMLTEQAGITSGEASRRIQRYARFRDLSLGHVSGAVLDGRVRLLTLREHDDVTRRAAGSDGHANPV